MEYGKLKHKKMQQIVKPPVQNQAVKEKQGFFDFEVVEKGPVQQNGNLDFQFHSHNAITSHLSLDKLRHINNIGPVHYTDMKNEGLLEQEKRNQKQFQKKRSKLKGLINKVQNAKDLREGLYKKSIREPGSLSEQEQAQADIYEIDKLREEYENDFEGMTNEQVTSHTDRLNKLSAGTKEEKYNVQNLKDYSTNEYYPKMNGFLRSNDPNTTQEIKDKCADMIKTIDSFSLDKNMCLTRHMGLIGLVAGLGLNMKEINTSDKLFEAMKKMNVHRTISGDKAFCSTTTKTKGIAPFNDNQVECRILAPKGTKAVCIRNISKYPREEEILLQANTKFQIIGIEPTAWVESKGKKHEDKKIIVYMKIVQEEALEQKDRQDEEKLRKQHLEQGELQNNRYRMHQSLQKMDFKTDYFGYKSVMKKGVPTAKAKAANSKMWGAAANIAENRCLMALGIYYYRTKDREGGSNILSGIDVDWQEVLKIQGEVEAVMTDKKVNRDKAWKAAQLLSEMKAGIAANLTPEVLSIFKDKGDDMAEMTAGMPYMTLLMHMQKAYEDMRGAVKNQECKNACRITDSTFIRQDQQEKLDKLSKCKDDSLDSLHAYGRFLDSPDYFKISNHQGLDPVKNPFDNYKAVVSNAYKKFQGIG